MVLKITLFFRYTEYEQYLTYDYRSFVADFGGYLGLLLGSSLLTFYDLFKRWATTIIRCIKDKSDKKHQVSRKKLVSPSQCHDKQ